MKNNRVVSNAGWIISCKLCKAILTLFSTMIISRYLGVTQYGMIGYAASLISFVTPIMKLGLGEILVHEIISCPNEEGETLGTTIILNLLASIVCVLGIGGFVAIVNSGERNTFIVCMCYSVLLIFQAMEMIYYWFQAKLMSKYTSIAILVSYLVVVGIQVILVLLKANVYLLALSYTMEYFFIAVILLFFYKRKNNMKLRFSFSKAKHLLGQGKHYIVSGLMVMIFSQTDKIMLKLMCDDAVVGIYAAATTCAGMTSFVFAAIIDSMRPTIFSVKNENVQFEKKMVSLYSIIIWFSLIQSLIITLGSPLIIHILYGSAYRDASTVLRVVVWFTTFSYLGTIRNIWILANNYQHYLGRINFSGAVVNILFNMLLIPKYGAIGAAIASVIAQVFTNIITGIIIKPLRRNNELMIKAISPYNIIKLIK